MPVQKKKKTGITPEELDEMVKAWVLVPHLMAELFKRAKEGNRTAKSIIASAKGRLEYSTELIEPKRGQRPKKLIASHCPSCGKKLEGV